MATAALISVDEYLSTSYRPDCDYVDGEILKRNLGERAGQIELPLVQVLEEQVLEPAAA